MALFDIRKAIKLIAPRGSASIVSMVVDHWDEQTKKWGITTVNRQIHLLAHMCVESGNFTTLTENLHYSPERLLQVFPARIKTLANARKIVAGGTASIAEAIYGNRKDLGNIQKGDGAKSPGTGLLQTTGMYNRRKLAAFMKVDVDTLIKWLTDPAHAFACACANFVMNGCLPYADQDNIRGSTLKVNGGTNGLKERTAARDALKAWVAHQTAPAARPVAAVGIADLPAADDAPEAPDDAPEADGAPDILDAVPDKVDGKLIALKQKLANDGYKGMLGKIDDDNGPQTKATVIAFQAENGLPETGVIDEDTEAAIWAAGPRLMPDSRLNATADDLRAKGSETIAGADAAASGAKKIGLAGSLAVGSTALDMLGTATDTADRVKTTSETAQGLMPWFQAHFVQLLVFVLVGLIGYWLYRDVFPGVKRVIAARVGDHREGNNIAI